MRTIHFVYSFGPKKSCPNAIANELTERLSRYYRVIQHQWDSEEIIIPTEGDILLGHPYYSRCKCFYDSMHKKGWSRVIGMWPFSSGEMTHSAFQDTVIYYCDLFLLITGPYWFTTLGDSIYSHWLPKVRHLDLAINRNDFPVVKANFNPPRQRKFVYIGSSGSYKNVSYLSALAQANPTISFSWIGEPHDNHFPGIQEVGAVDFQSQDGLRIITEYDFLITVGKSDPNPATILEAMAWGLIPICTPESGYFNSPGILNVPLNDIVEASRVIQNVNELPLEELRKMQQINWQALDSHYNWDRFAGQVVDAIESKESPRINSSLYRKLLLRYYASIAPWDSTIYSRANLSLRKIDALYRLGRWIYRKLPR
jgi:glycosyltransferase involved in cell wall biosynthesis